MVVGILTPVIVGIICIVIGISNRKGTISTLHSYHRARVSEEDTLPFGKQIGTGMIFVGASVIAMGLFTFAAELFEKTFLVGIGTAVMIVGMVIGFVIAFHAMIKYNKGIF